VKRWLRHHLYAFKVASRRLVTQPFSTLSNLLVISLSLALPLLASGLLISLQPIAKQLPISPEITIFLSQETDESSAQSLADNLADNYNDVLAGTTVVSRETAMANLKENPAWSDALAVLPDNPLPHAIVATLKESDRQASIAKHLAEQWQDLQAVDAVQLDSDWVRRLEAILQFLKIGLGLLALGVGIVVLATVFNTVRMQALTQREEIAVARLVGATEAFVRRPFLYLGATTGLVGGGLAIGLSTLALIPLNRAVDRLAQSYETHTSLQLPNVFMLLLFLFLVACLGALAARWSVTRNT